MENNKYRNTNDIDDTEYRRMRKSEDSSYEYHEADAEDIDEVFQWSSFFRKMQESLFSINLEGADFRSLQTVTRLLFFGFRRKQFQKVPGRQNLNL